MTAKKPERMERPALGRRPAPRFGVRVRPSFVRLSRRPAPAPVA
jgi:hypothetical protein